MAGAESYVVTHPDLDGARACLLEVRNTCLVVLGLDAPSDDRYRLVAIDDSGGRGTPSEPFGFGRSDAS